MLNKKRESLIEKRGKMNLTGKKFSKMKKEFIEKKNKKKSANQKNKKVKRRKRKKKAGDR